MYCKPIWNPAFILFTNPECRSLESVTHQLALVSGIEQLRIRNPSEWNPESYKLEGSGIRKEISEIQIPVR